MFKRMLLAVSFVVALGVAGLASSTASAHGGCGYGGYRAAYYPTYASVYDYGYYPTVSYARPVYPVYYRGFDGHRHHHRHSGVTFTFGF
jgi:hypothetical protein